MKQPWGHNIYELIDTLNRAIILLSQAIAKCELIDTLCRAQILLSQAIAKYEWLFWVIIGVIIGGLLIYKCLKKTNEVQAENLVTELVDKESIMLLSGLLLIVVCNLLFVNTAQKLLYNNEASHLSEDCLPRIMNQYGDAEKEAPQKLDIMTREEVFSSTHKYDLVNYYIMKCVDEILPITVWEALSDEELYYIRNGICAYSGRIYESGYYDSYPWYEGTIAPNDFDCSVLNDIQYLNVENIRSVEDYRKANQGSDM